MPVHQHEFTMLVSSTCPACKAAKREFSKDIDSGRIHLVDVDSDEGASLVKKHNIQAVPQVLKKKGNSYQACDIGYENNKLKIECDD